MSDLWKPSDVQRRLPVWHALSTLFLDTQLQTRDYVWIAQRLAGSGYSAEELHLILDREVAPAFEFNLIDVAGEWAGWNEETVLEIISQPRNRSGPTRWFRKRRLARYVDSAWKKIVAHLGP